jgi:hypothetical protein
MNTSHQEGNSIVPGKNKLLINTNASSCHLIKASIEMEDEVLL